MLLVERLKKNIQEFQIFFLPGGWEYGMGGGGGMGNLAWGSNPNRDGPDM
jgi:hypothetical protein